MTETIDLKEQSARFNAMREMLDAPNDEIVDPELDFLDGVVMALWSFGFVSKEEDDEAIGDPEETKALISKTIKRMYLEKLRATKEVPKNLTLLWQDVLNYQPHVPDNEFTFLIGILRTLHCFGVIGTSEMENMKRETPLMQKAFAHIAYKTRMNNILLDSNQNFNPPLSIS